MSRFLRGISLYALIVLLAVMVVIRWSEPPGTQRNLDVPYSQFLQMVEQGRIKSVRMLDEQRIDITTYEEPKTPYYTIVPPGTTNLADRLEAKNVAIQAEVPKQSIWLVLLPNLITIVIFVVVWLFIINQMQGGNNRAMSFGKSRAKLHSEEKSKVRFDDVAGVDEAKQELVEIVEFLKQPKKFVELGAKIPKGVLLMGPPGTGKTLLARAVAGEAGVPFFSISGSDFVEMFVGVGASRVRDLFDNAKKSSPCILFIDELDAVGRHRGAGLGGGHDEREQTLNQLLVEMDGFEANSGIIVMAATNRPDVLDPALLRPGRFDRKITVETPDLYGRKEILKIHARNKPLADDVDLEVLAKQTPGFSGADLENVLNEAAILAARRNRKVIGHSELEEAVDRVVMGPERKRRRMTAKDKEILAYHEAGHAVVAHYLPNADPVHKVTIVGRGMAGGYTMVLPEEERMVRTRAEMKDILAFMLGGRSAEEVVYESDEITTGAQNDLERVTLLARKMVTEWGMSEKLGPITYGHQHEETIFLGRDIARQRNYSEDVAATIDNEVRAIVQDAHNRAISIIKEQWDRMQALVEVLKEKETVNQETFLRIMREGRVPTDEVVEAGEPSSEAKTPAPAPSVNPLEKARESLGLDKKAKTPKPAIG